MTITSREIRNFVTSRGDEVQTYLTDEEAVQLLAKHDGPLSDFAQSLVSQALSRGLSDRQWPWLHKLALEHVPAEARPGYEASELVVLDLAPVWEMMERAAQHLKYPKILFKLEEGNIRIHRAGGNSRTPGAIMVTDGLPFGVNTFYGRVHTSGRWEPANFGCPEWVEDALRSLAENPVSYVGGYGRQTGNCCFCGRDLSDPRSTEVGYGPICAGRYGLPWGESDVDVAPVTHETPTSQGDGGGQDTGSVRRLPREARKHLRRRLEVTR